MSKNDSRRRVDGWTLVLLELREYLLDLQANVNTVSYAEIEHAKACVVTLNKVWDRVQV